MEDQPVDDTMRKCDSNVSLAAEMQEIKNKQDDLSTMSMVAPKPFSGSILVVEDSPRLEQASILDDTDPKNNFLSSYELIILFAFTTITILPSVFSTSNDTSWEDIIMSAMDPFLMPPTSMPPV